MSLRLLVSDLHDAVGAELESGVKPNRNLIALLDDCSDSQGSRVHLDSSYAHKTLDSFRDVAKTVSEFVFYIVCVVYSLN